MINKERLLRLLHIIMQSINEYRKIEAFFSFFSQDVCLNNNNKKMFMYLIFKLLSTARVCCEHMHGQHNCFQVFLIYRCSSVIDFERILIIIMDCLSLDRLFHVIYAVGKQKLKADNPIVMKVFILLSFCHLQCVKKPTGKRNRYSHLNNCESIGIHYIKMIKRLSDTFYVV